MADWLVRIYDKNNKIIRRFTVKDRTEHEAENEIFKEVKDAWDWSMTEIPKI